jgi:pimeloyl-ACP methyl ester carboxylesterase
MYSFISPCAQNGGSENLLTFGIDQNFHES